MKLRSAAEVREAIERASRRVEWAALALSAAAEQLDQAGEDGAPVGSLPDLLRTESECGHVLAQRIAEVGAIVASERRVRDRL